MVMSQLFKSPLSEALVSLWLDFSLRPWWQHGVGLMMLSLGTLTNKITGILCQAQLARKWVTIFSRHAITGICNQASAIYVNSASYPQRQQFSYYGLWSCDSSKYVHF